MTTADKTGDKLVQSIRKTKAGAAATASKPSAPTTRKKAQTRKASTKAAAKPPVKRKTASAATDPYQAGQRVWPD